VRVFTNTGGTLTLNATWVSDDVAEWHGIDAGDYDGDLIVTAGQSAVAPPVLFQNDGTGSFTRAWTGVLTTVSQDSAWGDADGDGDLDLAFADFNAAPDQVFVNPGIDLDPFSAETTEAFNGGDLGDFDADGDLDLAVTTSGYGVHVYETTVSGAPPSSTPMWTGEDDEQPWGCAWADADGDGDLELAIANTNGQDRVWAWDGANAFTMLWQSSSAVAEFSTAVDWADVDADGYPDVIVGGTDGEPIRVLHNNNGLSLGLAWDSGDDDEAYGIVPVDLDGDGDVDFAVGDLGGYDSVFLNDGTGAFVRGWTAPDSTDTQRVLAGDLDGDGDDDLVAVAGTFDGDGGLFVALNHRITDPLLPNDPTVGVLTTKEPNAGDAVVLGPTVPVSFTLVVVGVFGTAGVEIGLGSAPIALRPSFEGGFLGRHGVVRGLLQVVIAP